MSAARFKVGDLAYVARYGNTTATVPCPVCYGKSKVTVILGNEDHVEVVCDYCGKGFAGPRGYVEEYVERGEVEGLVVDSVESVERAGATEYTYRSGCRIFSNDNAFTTREEAEAKAQELAAEYKRHENTRAEYIKKATHKTFSWNAGYHLSESRRHRQQAEYHDRMAQLCKDRAKATPHDKGGAA